VFVVFVCFGSVTDISGVHEQLLVICKDGSLDDYDSLYSPCSWHIQCTCPNHVGVLTMWSEVTAEEGDLHMKREWKSHLVM